MIDLVLLAIALVLGIPSLVLFGECLAALFPTPQESLTVPQSLSIAVLVPAHNEASVIGTTLSTLIPQADRLVVVADNCSDETAAIAKGAGATVIERHDLEQRGKGYALDYGLKFLAANPPDVVVVVDADCQVAPGTIEKIAQKASIMGCPVQAMYLMEQPPTPKPKDSISALAFLVKNLVRPRGLAKLGLPCLLTGTGMAFPWALIANAPLASSNIVEDMQLSLDLALAGHPSVFESDSKVMGMLPQQDAAAKSQRTRWEHGHLQTLKTQVPRLLKAAVVQRRWDLLALALDLSVPPLSLLVFLWVGAIALALLGQFLGASGLPVLILALEGGLILLSILGAWARFGRAELPAKVLLAVPLYILWKLPFYLTFFLRRQTKWVRTERDVEVSDRSPLG